jgi:DNA-binding GntR family transcriptional regulator
MATSTTTRTGPAKVRPGGRDAAPLIRDHLRAEILKGHLDPGSEINQVQIAAEFGVSRGPVREAFRLLERDGLIDARVNHRARVTGLSVDDLEHLYALRVLNESVALSVSVPSFTSAELDELDQLAEVLMDTDPDTFDFETWDEVHQRFHTLLLAHSGSRMLASAAEWAAHTQRYRRAYAEGGRGLPQGAGEHLVLAQLCRGGDAPGATRLLALHLSRAALTLITQMAPTHEPVLLRAAIRQVVGPDDQC